MGSLIILSPVAVETRIVAIFSSSQGSVRNVTKACPTQCPYHPTKHLFSPTMGAPAFSQSVQFVIHKPQFLRPF